MNTRKLSAFAAKYKYVLIILLAGLILLLLPTGSKTKVKTAQASPVSEQTQTQTIQAEEQRLTTLLQQINGAGQVQVLLSYRCSAERELATDDSGEPTIISAGGGAQEAVELKTVSPQYLGAVVVCDGADFTAGAARRHAGSGTVYRPEHGSHLRAPKAAGSAI